MTHPSRTTVIIPVFNQAGLTAQCLESVLALDPCDVVVVDDGSTDETPRLLARYGARIRVLTRPENAGFAIACNAGAALAQTEFLVFLNNDTIPRPGWLLALERHADLHPTAAVVGSKLIFPDNTIQHAGVVICRDAVPRHLYAGFPADHPSVNRSRRFQSVTAACALVRRSDFEAIGGFDPEFRNGLEDVDLCLRLGARGREVHYCAESVVCHLESMSQGRFRHTPANMAHFRQRWSTRVKPDDLQVYVDDQLLTLNYEQGFPLALELSPLLAISKPQPLAAQLERCEHRVAEMRRDNVRLRADLAEAWADAPTLQYEELRQAIGDAVRQTIPPGATFLVASKGDSALLEAGDGRQGWHFPRTTLGAYAGHYPADSAEAIAQLEEWHSQGATYFVLPHPASWWLDHYADFRRHLDTTCKPLPAPQGVCRIYALNAGAKEQL